MCLASADNSTRLCSGSVVSRGSIGCVVHGLVGAITDVYEAASSVALLSLHLLVDEPKTMQ